MTDDSRSTSTDTTFPDYEFESSITGEGLGIRPERVHRPRTTKFNTWQCCVCVPHGDPHYAENYFHNHHVNFEMLHRTVMTDDFEPLPYDDVYSESNSSGSSKLSERARQETIDEVLSRAEIETAGRLDLVNTPAPEGHFTHLPEYITQSTEVFYTRQEYLEGERDTAPRYGKSICDHFGHPDTNLEETMAQNMLGNAEPRLFHYKCRECLEYTKVEYWVKNDYTSIDGDYERVVVRMSLEHGERFHRSKKGWIDSQGDRRLVAADMVDWRAL